MHFLGSFNSCTEFFSVAVAVFASVAGSTATRYIKPAGGMFIGLSRCLLFLTFAVFSFPFSQVYDCFNDLFRLYLIGT